MPPGIRMASWLLHGSARGLEQFQGQQGWNAFSCPNRPSYPSCRKLHITKLIQEIPQNRSPLRTVSPVFSFA